MRFLTLGIALSLLASTAPAMAQEIGVRVGEHKNYTRLVLDGAGAVKYSLKNDKSGNLRIVIPPEATLDIKAQALGNVMGVAEGENGGIVLNIPADSRVRDFKIGKKLVIDVYNSPSGQKAAPPQKQVKAEPSKPREQETVKQATAPKPAPETQSAEEKMEEQLEELAKDPAVSVDKVQLPPPNEIASPNLISFSSTKGFNLAAFQDGEDFFIVSDRVDDFIKPQVSGPNADRLRQFRSMDIGEARAYYVRLPGPVEKVRAEGSGLLWRVILGAQKETGEPVEIEKRGASSENVRGGSVFFPLDGATGHIVVENPYTAEQIHVVTVDDATVFAGEPRHFIEFEVLRSPIGLAIRPLVDDIEVTLNEDGVEVSRPGGLVLMPDSLKLLAHSRKIAQDQRAKEVEKEPIKRIYKFKDWRLGGVNALHKNKNVILTSLKERDQARQIEDLIALAKMYLANARGAEALGFLRFAAQEFSEIQQTPEFLALRGAAKAIDWKSEDAFRDLSHPLLEPYKETEYWRAYALADLGDWQQAGDVLPDNVAPIYDYPPAIRRRLGLVLAEISLRAGRVAEAAELLDVVEGAKENGVLLEPMILAESAAVKYLRGEAERQRGNLRETVNYWQPLTRGKDELYRAKAGLALTRLLIEEARLTHDEAIDHLERLRYSWRGDDLEAQINYWLGRKYFEEGDYVKGLGIMRDAASYAPDTDMGRLVTREMAESFKDLYMSDKLDDVSPLDAVAIYEQFAELVPTGAQGDLVVERLAERLVQADLLQRAGNLLQHQVEHRISGKDAIRVAIRLAGIRLLDREPEKSMESLNLATQELRKQPASEERSAQIKEITLLRASALAMQGRADQALALLEDVELTPEVNRLRTDIAWASGYWDDAEEALGDVIIDEDISLTRPLSEEHTQLILNRAIALNLSSDRIGLANMREKYSEAMSQTERARLFEVVTRARQSPALADRQTLLSITSEVDLFSGFLEGYRKKADDLAIKPVMEEEPVAEAEEEAEEGGGTMEEAGPGPGSGPEEEG